MASSIHRTDVPVDKAEPEPQIELVDALPDEAESDPPPPREFLFDTDEPWED